MHLLTAITRRRRLEQLGCAMIGKALTCCREFVSDSQRKWAAHNPHNTANGMDSKVTALKFIVLQMLNLFFFLHVPFMFSFFFFHICDFPTYSPLTLNEQLYPLATAALVSTFQTQAKVNWMYSNDRNSSFRFFFLQLNSDSIDCFPSFIMELMSCFGGQIYFSSNRLDSLATAADAVFFKNPNWFFFHFVCQVFGKKYGDGFKAPQVTMLLTGILFSHHLFGVVKKCPATIAVSKGKKCELFNSLYTIRFHRNWINLFCEQKKPKTPNPKQHTPKTLKSSRPRRPNVHICRMHTTHINFRM